MAKTKEEIAAYQREYRKRNREKLAAADKKRRADRIAADPEGHKERERRFHLRKRYGITPEFYDELFERQGGRCALCFREPSHRGLHTDHCHTSGRVRGLLCHQCNWYLGIIDADPTIIERIQTYRSEPE